MDVLFRLLLFSEGCLLVKVIRLLMFIPNQWESSDPNSNRDPHTHLLCTAPGPCNSATNWLGYARGPQQQHMLSTPHGINQKSCDVVRHWAHIRLKGKEQIRNLILAKRQRNLWT
eukprot:TRINITY_DN32351_c0_g1_i1.p1 TRINITY_DN32351_c0_g1~~TRINITY_DN32351_c0_g1_i1.p1  ORF type:complete len:115 (-),score=2.65 TRINITY_DN32351_c0_g1_i1:17-361(-)